MPTTKTSTSRRKATGRSCAAAKFMSCDNERQIKSVERVRDLGEVFTPSSTIGAMLDLLPPEIWDVHPSPTFLEPACGDGNFLVSILARKLDRVADAHAAGLLPAGAGVDALRFHGLQALSSIYAVDISVDNVVGGTPGHEVGARDRLSSVFAAWFAETSGLRLTSRSVLMGSVRWVVERNVQVGNMLPFGSDGRPSGRELLPLVEYTWVPADRTVAVSATTLGAVMAASSSAPTAMTLFDSFDEPTTVWTGPAAELRSAPIAPPTIPEGPARNGRPQTR